MTLLIAFLVSPLNYLQMIQISSYLGNLLIWKIFTRLSLSQSSEDNDPGWWRACFPTADDPVSLSPYILMWLTPTCRLLKHLYREAYRPAVKRLSNNWQLVKLPAVWAASRSTFPFPAHWDAAVGTRVPFDLFCRPACPCIDVGFHLASLKINIEIESTSSWY